MDIDTQGPLGNVVRRINANALKLGIPFVVASLALVVFGLNLGMQRAGPAAFAWAGIFGIVGLVAFLTRISHGSAQSYLRRILKPYGEPGELAGILDAQIPEGSVFKRLVITDSWILVTKFLSLVAFPSANLMWIYRSEVQHYVNGIKGAKEIYIMLHLRTGAAIKVKISSSAVGEAMLSALTARCPWAIAGYSMELDSLWKRGRAEWIANVDDRRAGIEPAEAGKPAAVPAMPGRQSRAGLILGLGLGSCFVPLPIGIAALILGIIEKRDEAAGKVESKGMTTAGIVLGIFGSLTQLGLVAMSVARFK